MGRTNSVPGKKRIKWIFAALALISLAIAVVCLYTAANPQSVEAAVSETAGVVRGDIEATVSGAGSIQAEENLRIRPGFGNGKSRI